MLVQGFEGVEFLLFQHAGLLLHAYLTDISIVIILKMLFEEGNRRKFFVHLAGLAINLDKALELC